MGPNDSGYLGGDNNGDGLMPGPPVDTPMESVLSKLSSMLEECLFYMVDWVNRTEIFRVIPVS